MLDKAKIAELERFVEMRASRKGLDPDVIYAVGTAGAAVELTLTDLRALLRLARAVADAPRVDADSEGMVFALMADADANKTFILLRADAAGAGEG